MEIGKYLLKYNEFPSQIVDCIEEERGKRNKDSSKTLGSITYKDKVLSEFSNSAYLRLTGEPNFDHVPGAIYDLWSNVQSLSTNEASDSEWKTLYEKLKKEFDKLK